MEEKDNTFDLARISFEGENYSDAYDKFSKTIEKDTTNKDAWVFKGLCAAYLASPNGKGFKEAEVCLNQALKIGLNENDKELIAESIINSSKNYVEKIFKILQEAELESEKKPMATGELYAVRNVRLLAERMTALVANWENFKTAIEFCRTSLNYSDTTSTAKKILAIIDTVHGKSTERNAGPKYLPELESIRNQVVSKISSVEPSYTPPPVNSTSDGCFIATAVYGNYDAPEVIELRDFRDEYLKKSPAGRKFIRLYYKWSPALAEFIKTRSLPKKIAYYAFVLPPTITWRLLKKFNS